MQASRTKANMGTGYRALSATALALMLTLSACAHYQAAPMDLKTAGGPSVHAGDLPADADAQTLLQLALQRDPAVAAARATLAAAEANRKAARNLPPLSLMLTVEYSKDADPQKPWLYGGAVGIPLDTGARRAARVTGADLTVIRARYALAEAVWGVRQRLYQALNDLSLSAQEIALNQTLLDQRIAYQALIQKRVRHGEEAQGVAAQAALDVSGARQALAEAKARHIAAVAAVAHALDADVAAVEAMTIRPAAELDVLDEAQLRAMIDKAVYHRADVLLAVVDYDVAENDLRTAIAAQYPDISLQPGYNWERGQVKIPFSLSLTLPPLDGNRAAIDAAQSTRLAAGKTLESVVKATRSNAAQAATTYSADLGTARSIATTDLPVSRDMAARAQRMKLAGEGDQADALLAELNATQTQIHLLQAQRTAHNDRLALEDALHQTFDTTDTRILSDAVKTDEVTQ
ncbi:hypothetical protein ABAC460_12895 [Asticcacaulis sp. AC460]|nr:hypothetical protein ABAC460_12895 [Asticcacaulis sp. AC460]